MLTHYSKIIELNSNESWIRFILEFFILFTSLFCFLNFYSIKERNFKYMNYILPTSFVKLIRKGSANAS